MAQDVRALVFDLGNVVIDVDFARVLAAFAPHSRLPAQQLRAFGLDDAYRRHETGHLAEDAYFAHLRERFALECDEALIRAGWNAIFVAPIHETVRLIDRVRGRLPCYALSNTNPAHLAEMQRAFGELLARFERVFVSHEIGYRKPHPQAFGHVVQAIDAMPGEMLFFDDLPENVEAARACGLQAALVESPADIERELAARRLL